MSNGGFMSFLLACQLSDKIAAIASVAGSMSLQTQNSCNTLHPTPILVIHGDADNSIPYTGNAWSKSVDNGTTVEHFKVLGGGHDWPGVWGNMDFYATNEILRFFSKYDINGLIGHSGVINSQKNSQQFKIYPNPTKSIVSIDGCFSTPIEYKLYSILGELIYSENIYSNNNQINISSLQSGLYILIIGEQTFKIFKN